MVMDTYKFISHGGVYVYVLFSIPIQVLFYDKNIF